MNVDVCFLFLPKMSGDPALLYQCPESQKWLSSPGERTEFEIEWLTWILVPFGQSTSTGP